MDHSNACAGVQAAARVGTEVAAAHADDVDRQARFPREALEALKKEKLLGAFVPQELGGLGHGMIELAAACTALAQNCSSGNCWSRRPPPRRPRAGTPAPAPVRPSATTPPARSGARRRPPPSRM